MTNDSFQARLGRAMRDGNLTVADLSIWFGRPYQTVRSWVYARRSERGRERKSKKAYEPWGPYREEAERRLRELETIIKRNPHWLPYGLSQTERRVHMKAIRREHNGRVPKAHSAA